MFGISKTCTNKTQAALMKINPIFEETEETPMVRFEINLMLKKVYFLQLLF